MNEWTCDKCMEKMNRNDLSELFGWGLYFCSPCIEKFIEPERSKREDSMDNIYDQIFERSGCWLELSEEMRCSEHGGNVVREVQ